MHKVPVYVAAVQRLFASRLAPPEGFLPQLVVDLSWGTFAGFWFIGVGIFEFRVSGNARNAGVFVVLEGFADGCCRCIRREYVD